MHAGWHRFWDARADRLAAARARRVAPAQGWVWEPLPRPPGHFARGRQIAAGSWVLAGKAWDSTDPFATPPPSAAFAQALHGWTWLDDLAACGEAPARDAARRWLADWLARFGSGQGPGWRADLTGARVFRWIDHGLFLTAGAPPALTDPFLASLGAQAAFLAWRWPAAPAGLPRIQALTGWLHAGRMLAGLQDHAAPALAALAAQAGIIGADGGVPSRRADEVLGIAAHLMWCQETVQATGGTWPDALAQAQARAARALRMLRHADGSLARFHGGAAGPDGLADRVLGQAPDRARPSQAMGYARMDGGRSSVIVDAAPPPATLTAGASALAFELTSARRPLIVSCGAGADFGADWDLAGRQTAAFATLSPDGLSQGTFAHGRGGASLHGGAGQVTLHRSDDRQGTTLRLAHDAWVASHGLTHSRTLTLTADGRALMGDDALAALAPADKTRLDRVLAGTGGRGLGFAVRFHLHPDAEVRPEGAGARIALPSGEVWRLRADGATMGLDPSVWLEPGRRAPRPCRQIVLRGALTGAQARIGWTLAKAQDTPLAIRDTGRAETHAGAPPLPPDFFDRD